MLHNRSIFIFQQERKYERNSEIAFWIRSIFTTMKSEDDFMQKVESIMCVLMEEAVKTAAIFCSACGRKTFKNLTLYMH